MTQNEISTILPVTNYYHQDYPVFDKLRTFSSTSELITDTFSSASEVVLPAEEKKTFWKGVNDWLGWLGSLIGVSNQLPAVVELAGGTKETAIGSVKSSIPKLEAPTAIDQTQLAKTIMEINREIEKQLEEVNAFEEEMRKADSSYLDTRFLQEQISCSMIQKKLREANNADRQEDSLEEQRQHQELQTAYYDLKKAIADHESRQPILKWVGYGTTGATLGVLAATFATGGTAGILVAATGILALSKAGLTAFKGVLKHYNDKNMGELFVVKYKMDECSTKMKKNLSDMRTFNAEIAKMLKAIKENLDTNYEATKAVIR